MVKRERAIPVTLSASQRERLERLWFYFGNYGPKTTPGNHSFIQRLLENGIDERPLHTRRTPKSELPTPECVCAVEAVLQMKGSEATEQAGGGLRLVSSAAERPRPESSPELKAMLDDMRRRYRVKHEREATDTDAPDAA